MARAIAEAHRDLAAEAWTTPGELRVAMRSSAIGEDGELSFAGQYLSLLNVPAERLISSYKYVAASLYTPRAISYRALKGIADDDVAMSVACLEMVPSRAAGVMYTRHPLHPDQDRVIINAVWGLGPYAVDGVVNPDTYAVARDGSGHVETRVSDKPVMLVGADQGTLAERPVPPELREAPCLDPEQAGRLAEYGLALERHYGGPQDVEWALDPKGRLVILQSRPLAMAGGADAPWRAVRNCPRSRGTTSWPRAARRPCPGSARGRWSGSFGMRTWRAFPRAGCWWPGIPRRNTWWPCPGARPWSPSTAASPGTWPPCAGSSGCPPCSACRTRSRSCRPGRWSPWTRGRRASTGPVEELSGLGAPRRYS